MKFKFDKFVLAILVTIGIAYAFPQWGLESSPVPIDAISAVGIALIFFFYGLKLSPAQIKTGMVNWRLHLLIQASTFLIFPLLVLALRPLVQTVEQETYWLGFFFLAALPSTVSSSVVMVSLAKGNIPAAIFNASISGIIGMAMTPLWIGLFVPGDQTGFDLTEVILQMLVQIILPVGLGLLLQRFFGDWVRRHNSTLTLFDKSIILLIIYKSFAHSFSENLFQMVSLLDLLLMIIAVLALFWGMYLLVGYLAKLMDFSYEDRVTAKFCGTKKSLVHGTVFSKILFEGLPTLGIILLPLMLFHALQILIISTLASAYRTRLL